MIRIDYVKPIPGGLEKGMVGVCLHLDTLVCMTLDKRVVDHGHFLQKKWVSQRDYCLLHINMAAAN